MVINVAGLSGSLIGESSPNICAFIDRGRMRRLEPVLPAVTCTVQSSMLTGRSPGGAKGHGIVGNGWYDRESAEVRFWKQSNRLVGGEKVWETARRRDPSVTCCNMFWWFNMYSSADYAVTPRPIYKADGRKISDIYTEPADLRDLLQERLGRFPLFDFWGPGASIESSRWIADAARLLWERHHPTLCLVYLPHLDYGLQKLGPDHPEIPGHVRAVDEVVGALIDELEGGGARVIILSEYGLEAVDGPIHINRRLREAGVLRVRQEQGLELLDAGASEAFAVADHQVAHVYVKAPGEVERLQSLARSIDGVEHVLDRREQARFGLDHPRAGDLVLVARRGRWFSYPYWLDDTRAPDFARTVDIHRKPGYDPCELFIDPKLRWPKGRIAWRLLCKSLGFRALLDVIPLDASLVRGSHGRIVQTPQLQPVLITRDRSDRPDVISCREVRDVILETIFL